MAYWLDRVTLMAEDPTRKFYAKRDSEGADWRTVRNDFMTPGNGLVFGERMTLFVYMRDYGTMLNTGNVGFSLGVKDKFWLNPIADMGSDKEYTTFTKITHEGLRLRASWNLKAPHNAYAWDIWVTAKTPALKLLDSVVFEGVLRYKEEAPPEEPPLEEPPPEEPPEEPPVEPPTPTTGKLDLTILDHEEKGVPDVTFTIAGITAITGAGGKYTSPDIQPGHYDFTLKKEGYYDRHVGLDVSAGEIATALVHMYPLTEELPEIPTTKEDRAWITWQGMVQALDNVRTQGFWTTIGIPEIDKGINQLVDEFGVDLGDGKKRILILPATATQNAFVPASEIEATAFTAQAEKEGLKGFLNYIKAVSPAGVKKAVLNAPSWVKVMLKGAVSVMGLTTFTEFIQEEALQTKGIGIYVLLSKGLYDDAEKSLDEYEAMVDKAYVYATTVGALNPLTYQTFKTYFKAAKSQVADYREAIASGKRRAKIREEKALEPTFTRPTRTMVEKQYKKGVIDETEARHEFTALGYSNEDVDDLIATVKLEITPEAPPEEVPELPPEVPEAERIGTIAVRCNKRNANIYLDDEFTYLLTPETLKNIPGGVHTIRVEFAGYATQTKTVEITAPGQKIEIYYTLEETE